MSELEQWLRRQAAREQRIVLLEEGLLGDRLWRYAFYRLRFLFLRYVVESVAHAVTVLLLFRGLAWENFLLVVIAVAATSLVSSFWWGALEGMRAQVRDLHRSGRPHRIPSAIAGWLAVSAILGGVVLALGVAWTVGRAVDGHLGVGDAYVGAALLRLALDLPTRCYHSGVYALRRIYKPVAATIGPDLVGIGVIFALWPVIEAWALVAAAVVVTAALTAVNLHYVGRVYHFLGFAPQRQAALQAIRASLRGYGRESLAGGASHAVMALDSLVVLALLYGAETDSESLLVLFLAAPTVRAAFDWARILYFDLKRLELRLFTNLRRRFERHTAQLAWLLGVVFWIPAAAIATAFLERSLGVLYLALLGFFVARSLLARAQIQAFAEGSYAAVLGIGVLCLVGFASIGPLAESESERLAGIGLVAAVCAAGLARLTRGARARGEPGKALLTLEWLRRLGHFRDPVRVGSARVAAAAATQRLDARTREQANRWRLAQLAEHTARRLGRAGAAAWIGPDRVVWFEPAGDPPRITADYLQRTSGGLIRDVLERVCATGEEALLVGSQDRLLGRASEHLLTAIVPVDVKAARRSFDDLVCGGVVYSPDEPVPAAFAALPGSELRAILTDAVAFARDLGLSRRRSRFDVTPLCSGGELRLIFVADLHSGKRARGRWRHLVTMLNVRAAIGGERRPRTQPGSLDRLAFLRA